MSDIALAEQWLKETSAAIRTLCDQLGVDNIHITGTSCTILGHDNNGHYCQIRCEREGYDGIFADERGYYKG